MITKIKKYRWTLLPLLAVLCFLATLLFRQSPEWVETYYSQSIYPLFARIVSFISKPLPFSLSDIFYLILILSPFSLLTAILLKKISLKKAGILQLNLLAASYILFYFLWGFNYYREPLAERLGIEDRKENTLEFVNFMNTYIVRLNDLQCPIEELDKVALDKELESTYQKLSPVLGFKYPMGKRKDKQITFSNFYAKSGISGYFGPFFNEVHVNKKVLPLEYPFVLAHEKAHQLGVTSEAEANFYAWLVCSKSTSQYIQYSGNLFILFHLLRHSYQMEEYKNWVEQLSPEVRKDIRIIQKHWNNLRNEKMDKAASKVNDTYLKSNNVKAGVKDYHGVVEHVMNFSLDSVFLSKHGLEDL